MKSVEGILVKKILFIIICFGFSCSVFDKRYVSSEEAYKYLQFFKSFQTNYSTIKFISFNEILETRTKSLYEDYNFTVIGHLKNNGQIEVRKYNVSYDLPLNTFKLDTRVSHISHLSSKGNYFANVVESNDEQSIKLWDLSQVSNKKENYTLKKFREIHLKQEIVALKFDPNEKYLAVATQADLPKPTFDIIHLFELKTLKEVHKIKKSIATIKANLKFNRIEDFFIDSTGSFICILYTGHENYVSIYDMKKKKMGKKFFPHENINIIEKDIAMNTKFNSVFSNAFFVPNGNTLMLSSRNPQWIFIWDFVKNKSLGVLEAKGVTNDMVYDERNDILITGQEILFLAPRDDRNNILVWDLSNHSIFEKYSTDIVMGAYDERGVNLETNINALRDLSVLSSSHDQKFLAAGFENYIEVLWTNPDY